MNYAEKMERESRLMGRLTDWMQAHGRVLSDCQRSNAYTGVRIREIEWVQFNFTGNFGSRNTHNPGFRGFMLM